ncbi:MAG TPA: hypothetical protein VJA46_07670 [Acidimicrobiia bacterium]|nr:hypothetical protein [Acidimicrobiia bacterium]
MDWANVDWGVVGMVASGFLVALATWFAAVAARRSADAADRSADLTRKAALLATTPRVVPWVSKGQIGTAINRGVSEAFNLSWTVIALEDGATIHSDDRQKVLPVEAKQSLWEPASGVAEAVRHHRAGAGIEIVCDFRSSWGQQFTLKRRVGKLRNQEPRLYDENGEEVKIDV